MQNVLPFNDPDADIIICSSDGVKFRTFKSNLAQISLVFKTMFTLPQSSPHADSEDYEDGIQVVRVSETAHVLNALLMICLPGAAHSDSKCVALAVEVLLAVRKYDMDSLLACAGIAFDDAMMEKPVLAYFLACQHGLEGKARDAARYCLRLPLSVIINTSFEGINEMKPLLTFQRLLQYHLACRDRLLSLISSWGWMMPMRAELLGNTATTQFWFKMSNNCCWSESCRDFEDSAVSSYSVQKWWAKYIKSVRDRLEGGAWEGVVQEKDALRFFMAEGPDCRTCRSAAVDSISAFAKALSAEMTKVLDGVSVRCLDL